LQNGIAKIAVRGPVEHAVLDISGELDFSSVDDAIEVVGALPHHIVSIDLAGLDFVDGAGARAIERIRQDRRVNFGEMPAIIGATPAVERTLKFVRSREPQLLVR
jgi:anti-anti-sigma regulatory factor